MPNIELLRDVTFLQTIVALFIVLMYLALYSYVHREPFFLWWGWGFAAYGVSLFLSWVSLLLPLEWDARRIAVVIGLNTAALMQIPLVLCGTEAIRTRDARRRLPMWLIGGAALGLGVSLVPLSLMVEDTVAQYALRTAPRHALLAITFFYSSWVFFRASRNRSSRGALITSAACFLYASVRAIWTMQLLPGVPLWEGSDLFYLDFASILGIALAAVLLMLERYGEARERLTLFEQILPTCSMCGIVRDDSGHEHGEGEWIELHEYMTRRTATQLSHTFCPKCVVKYKSEQGLT